MHPVAFHGASPVLRSTARSSMIARPAFGNTHEIERGRLEALYERIENDMAEGRLKVKHLEDSKTAVLDINGREYKFHLGKDTYFLRHAIKEEVKKVRRFGFLRWTKTDQKEEGIELGISSKFLSPWEQYVTYSHYRYDGKNAGRQHYAFIRDESRKALERAERFFLGLSRHVFTEERLKPFLPENLPY